MLLNVAMFDMSPATCDGFLPTFRDKLQGKLYHVTINDNYQRVVVVKSGKLHVDMIKLALPRRISTS